MSRMPAPSKEDRPHGQGKADEYESRARGPRQVRNPAEQSLESRIVGCRPPQGIGLGNHQAASVSLQVENPILADHGGRLAVITCGRTSRSAELEIGGVGPALERSLQMRSGMPGMVVRSPLSRIPCRRHGPNHDDVEISQDASPRRRPVCAGQGVMTRQERRQSDRLCQMPAHFNQTLFSKPHGVLNGR